MKRAAKQLLLELAVLFFGSFAAVVAAYLIIKLTSWSAA